MTRFPGSLPAVLPRALLALRHAVIGGGPDDPPTLAPARPPWLRRAVRIFLAVLAVCMSVFAIEVGWGSQYADWYIPTSQAVVWVLGAVPLVLVSYRPLLAWRLTWVFSLTGLVISQTGPACRLGQGFYGTVVLFGLDWTIEWPCRDWFPGQVVVFAVVLFAVGTAQDRGVLGWVWLVTGLLYLAGVDATEADGGDLVGGPLVLTGLLVAGYLVRRRSQARQRLVEVEERGTLLTERARIARELHDVVAHHMSMIAVRAETAPYRLSELPEAARREFAEISQVSREALTEMRRLLGVLRSDQPAATAPQPGLADLPELVESARTAGAAVTVDVDASLPRLPPAIDVSAYRILQEALTNAARHSPGAPIRVMVGRTADRLSVLVRNGPATRPAPAGPGRGHGIQGMRERVAMLDGDLRVGPTADGGFEVSATLPMRDGQ